MKSAVSIISAVSKHAEAKHKTHNGSLKGHCTGRSDADKAHRTLNCYSTYERVSYRGALSHKSWLETDEAAA